MTEIRFRDNRQRKKNMSGKSDLPEKKRKKEELYNNDISYIHIIIHSKDNCESSNSRFAVG